MNTTSVTDVLGRERNIQRVYGDGSFDCPFCFAGVKAPAPRCENPWCPASAHAMANPACAPRFQAQIDEQTRRDAEQAQRTRNHAAAMARIVESRTRESAWWDEKRDEATKTWRLPALLLPQE